MPEPDSAKTTKFLLHLLAEAAGRAAKSHQTPVAIRIRSSAPDNAANANEDLAPALDALCAAAAAFAGSQGIELTAFRETDGSQLTCSASASPAAGEHLRPPTEEDQRRFDRLLRLARGMGATASQTQTQGTITFQLTLGPSLARQGL